MAKFTMSEKGNREVEVSDGALVLMVAALGAVVVGVVAIVTRSPETVRVLGDVAKGAGQLAGGGRKLLR